MAQARRTQVNAGELIAWRIPAPGYVQTTSFWVVMLVMQPFPSYAQSTRENEAAGAELYTQTQAAFRLTTRY